MAESKIQWTQRSDLTDGVWAAAGADKIIDQSIGQSAVWSSARGVQPLPKVTGSFGTITCRASWNDIILIREAASYYWNDVIPRCGGFGAVGTKSLKLLQDHLLVFYRDWGNTAFPGIGMLASLGSMTRVCRIAITSKLIRMLATKASRADFGCRSPDLTSPTPAHSRFTQQRVRVFPVSGLGFRFSTWGAFGSSAIMAGPIDAKLVLWQPKLASGAFAASLCAPLQKLFKREFGLSGRDLHRPFSGLCHTSNI